MYYESFSEAIIVLLFWWVLSFIFLRLVFRHVKGNTWKKDIGRALIQAIAVLIFLPIMDYIVNLFR